MLTFILSTLLWSPSIAGTHTGVLTEVNGVVHRLYQPSSSPEGQGIHVFFEGKYYLFAVAKIGDELNENDVIQTMDGGKAVVTFANGDQLIVAPLSSLNLSSHQKAVNMNLRYGKVKNTINKTGPRNMMFVHTKSAVMGVRGTVFAVSDSGDSKGGTTLEVYRGKVSIQTHSGPKLLEIKAGDRASVEGKAIQSQALTPSDTERSDAIFSVQKSDSAKKSPEIQKLEQLALKSTEEENKTSSDDIQNKIDNAYKKKIRR